MNDDVASVQTGDDDHVVVGTKSATTLLRELRDIRCANVELQQLDFSNCMPTLKEYIRSMECLTNLAITTSSFGGTEGIGEFFVSLYRNMTIETLLLFGIDELESSGSALRDLIRRNKSMQNLSFSCNDLNACSRFIAQGLQQNKTLRNITFDGCNLHDTNFQEIVSAISSDRCGVQELLTNDNPLTILSLLQSLDVTKGKNATLRSLYFGFSNKVFTEDSGEWDKVVRFVEGENRTTTNLRDFSLEGCDIPHDACQSLIKALEKNTFLNFFAIDIESESSLLQLLETLPKIKSLSQLVISNYAIVSSLNNFEAELVNVIDKNKSLYRFKFESFIDAEPLSDKAQRKIQFCLCRNRLDSFFLAPGTMFRNRMWPFVFRDLYEFDAGPSAVYYVLRKKIDIVPQRVAKRRGQRNHDMFVDESIRRRCSRFEYL